MFKDWFRNLNNDDNPRLKRLPFLALWVVAYGLAWWVLFTVVMLSYDLTAELNILLITGVGLCFGVVPALMQGWLLRQRYGFIPRFWRGATLLGTMSSGFLIGATTNNLGGDRWLLWLVIMIWFSVPALMQAGVLFRVNRDAWLIAGLGVVTGLAGILITSTYFIFSNEIWAVLITTAMQAFGTGILTMRIMANPREGIVPKRDGDEKVKSPMRQTLHPIPFTALWAGAYFMGWVMLFVMLAMWMLIFDNLPIISAIGNWLENHAEWTLGIVVGGIIGGVSAWMQTWLITHYRGLQVKGWLGWNTVGWMLSGIAFYFYTNMGVDLALAGFFIAPAIFQMIPVMRARRAGWLWVLTGIVSYLVALTIEAQTMSTGNEIFFAVMLGGLVYAIVTASAFIVLSANAPTPLSEVEVA